MSKKRKRQRTTDLENPVCPGCRSPRDLVDVTDDNSGLLECTFCDIRFFIEEITEQSEEDVDVGGVVVDTRGTGIVHTPSVVVEPEPHTPVLGSILDVTEARHD